MIVRVRARDMYQKEKMRVYTDNKRNASERKLNVGDLVLLKQNKTDKLSTKYVPELYTVKNKFGNQVTVESPSEVEKVRLMKRNIIN